MPSRLHTWGCIPMNKMIWPSLVGVTLLSACSLMPNYHRPALPVPDQWPDGLAAISGKDSNKPLSDMGWEQFFPDKTLQDLITLALNNNRDLRVVALGIEQARAQLGIRSADLLPTVNAQATGSRVPTSSGGTSSTYTAGLIVTAYELDFFGRVASLKEQALAQYLATTEAKITAQLSLISTVAQSWLGLLADEAMLAEARQTLASREESLRLVALKLRHGAASELDLRLAQTLTEAARVTLAQQTQKRALDENALVLLLGQPLPPAARAVLSGPNPSAPRFAELPAGLPSDLLTRRPDVRAAEQTLIASNASIGAARAAFFPRISLTAGAGSASSELAGLFKDGSWGFTFAPQLVLPIFDMGRNQANLDATEAAQKIALAQYERAIQSAFREVADALAGRSALTQQLQAQTALVTAETERSRLTRLRYDNGAASALDWLDAQRSLFSANQALIQTRLAYQQNQVLFFKAVGGATTAPMTKM